MEYIGIGELAGDNGGEPDQPIPLPDGLVDGDLLVCVTTGRPEAIGLSDSLWTFAYSDSAGSGDYGLLDGPAGISMHTAIYSEDIVPPDLLLSTESDGPYLAFIVAFRGNGEFIATGSMDNDAAQAEWFALGVTDATPGQYILSVVASSQYGTPLTNPQFFAAADDETPIGTTTTVVSQGMSTGNRSLSGAFVTVVENAADAPAFHMDVFSSTGLTAFLKIATLDLPGVEIAWNASATPVDKYVVQWVTPDGVAQAEVGPDVLTYTVPDEATAVRVMASNDQGYSTAAEIPL